MRLSLLLAALGLLATAAALQAQTKLVVMIAGKPSHGPGQHEHNAGITLLEKCLKQGADSSVKVVKHLNGQWPDEALLDQASCVVIYSDGGRGHPALQEGRLAQLDKQMKRGCGFVAIHYAVEPTKELGQNEFMDWMGGCFEIDWSVNPHWQADFKALPAHPISQGVKPFSTLDEWYFHMRFRGGMQGVTPLLQAQAPESTMGRPDGAHSGNPFVRKAVAAGEPQIVAWAVERAGGGRGFGFTGGHFHKGWGHPDQRRLVLNAILWCANAEVPKGGVSSTISEADLAANLDPKPGQGLPEKPRRAK